MKKIAKISLMTGLLFFMMALTYSISSAYPPEIHNIFLNDQFSKLSFSCVTIKGITYVPIAEGAEIFGMEVKWTKNYRQVVLNRYYILKDEKFKVTKESKEKGLTVRSIILGDIRIGKNTIVYRPRIIGNVGYIPLRTLCRLAGAKVGFNAKNQAIGIWTLAPIFKGETLDTPTPEPGTTPPAPTPVPMPKAPVTGPPPAVPPGGSVPPRTSTPPPLPAPTIPPPTAPSPTGPTQPSGPFTPSAPVNPYTPQ